jgi:bifunctional non-homologous end joining protein LigD
MRVGRRTIAISRPEKMLFDDGVTKGDLVEHYVAVSGAMLPHVRERPMTLERYPDGIGSHQVFTKEIPKYFPDWIARAKLPKAGGQVSYVVCNEKATLAYLANQACITMHVGLSRVASPDNPDQMVFDLDPPEPDAALLRSVVKAVRAILEEVGFAPVVKTSGSKGLHVTVPLDGRAPFKDVRPLTRDVAHLVARRVPDLVTVEQRIQKRSGRLFLDWYRNSYGATVVAPWSVRPRPGAPVAVPLAWEEIEDSAFHPQMFSMSDAARRAEEPDPWKGWRRRARSITAARRRLDALLAE